MNDPFVRLGLTVVRLRWFVLAAWILMLAVCGPLFASKAASALKSSSGQVPNSESGKAAKIVANQFTSANPNNAVIVLYSSSLTVDDPRYKEQITSSSKKIGALNGVGAVADFFSTGNPGFVSPDRHTALIIATLKGDETAAQKVVPDLRTVLNSLSVEHYVTGTPGINANFETTTEHDLSQAEFVTIPITILLLLIVFRTVVGAAIPMILGAASVVLALTFIYLLGSHTDISIFALNVASMIGLGLGIDFSLILVSRYREELALGHEPRDAVAAAMATSGRSITYSGITVVLGMVLLTALFNLNIVRSISLGVMLVAITGLLAGLTLLPAMLAILGPRIEWVRVIPRGRPRAPGEHGIWYRFSHLIMAHPWLWLLGSLVLLVVLAVPAREIDVNGLDPGILPRDAESVKGSKALDRAFGANSLAPVQIVVQTDKNGVWRPEFLAAIQQLTTTVAADSHSQQTQSLFTIAQSFGVSPDKFGTLTPDFFKSDPARAAAASQYVNLSGDNNTALVTVVSKSSQFSDSQLGFIRDLRAKTIPGIRQLRTYDVFVGGNSALFVDEKAALYDRFPYLVAAVLAITYVILLMFFQSVFLPLKAILLNAVSVLATYGVIVALFQYGWGAKVLGFDSVGKLGLVTPAILFVILFSLSTDYEVFLLSRVKEYYQQTHNNEESVATGLEHTAGVITAAGLILIGVFGSFGAAGILTIKEIGVGLAVGVLLDSTVIRVVMVPATLRLTGNLNWYMPAWLKRIVPELSEGPAPELGLAFAGAQPDVSSAVAPPVAGRSAQDIPPLLRPAGAPAAQNAPPALRPAGLSPSQDGPPAPRPVQRAAPNRAPQVVQPREAPSNAHLRPVGSSIGTNSVPLTQRQPLRIGRSRGNELQLFDARISRFHARIDFNNGTFVLTDLNSLNGVYVNGQRIAPLPERVALRGGDRVQIGDAGANAFVFEVGSAVGAAGNRGGR